VNVDWPSIAIFALLVVWFVMDRLDLYFRRRKDKRS
jgi:hypothetical protein